MPKRKKKRRAKKKQRAESNGETRNKKTERPSGPRPFWSGTVSFGLVSLPVSLFAAVKPKRVSMRMVDEDGTPLSRRYFCPKEEKALDGDEIVRGYEVEKDKFITVEDDELDALAPEKSQEIDLRRFVPLSGIDPMYFERAYVLTPDKGAVKAYRLLAKAMEDTDRAGIATFVMRAKEYLVAIIAEDGILRAETMRFADELRSPDEVGLPDSNDADNKLVDELVKAMRRETVKSLDRKELEDRESQRLIKRAHQKLKAGDNVVKASDVSSDEDEEEPSRAEVVDLMAVLKKSLEQTDKEKKRSKKGKSKSADLEDLSKAKLYKRAQELDIEGRSDMNKEKLAEAIEKAG